MTNCTTIFQAVSSRTAFDRGHITPANPYRFSEDALSNTFYCINIAPQDPFTNQHPWTVVENRAHRYFSKHNVTYLLIN